MSERPDTPATSRPEIEALRERLRSGRLGHEDIQLLDRLLGTLLNLIGLLQQKNASLSRLKRMLFGLRSDARSADKAKPEASSAEGERSTPAAPEGDRPPRSLAQNRKPGHGRLKASAYGGARVVRCRDTQLQPGDRCPDPLCRGHLYDTGSPAVLIRLQGQPLVGATKYEQEVLRCSACQQRDTAPLPEGVKAEKYAPSADVAMVLAKYSAGLPFYRLARVQAAFGVPLPESVQFERCQAVADSVLPVYLHLRRLAAQGEVIFGDDTGVKILACLKDNKQLAAAERRGLQTTGLVIEAGGRRIALYASGRRHAGENIDELLKQRAEGLPPPIQMGDALSRNWSREFETIVAKCLAHARRQFVEIEAAFPAECGRVLDDLARVYRVEAETRGMTPQGRLAHHQEHSGPVLAALREWIEGQLAERRVEPNSSLGRALGYLRRHWEGLTQLLRVAGAPIDNNVCERALKLAVLSRKNSLFYKTEHGAAVGDLLWSLIESCRLNGVSPWSYLLSVMSHAQAARQNPAAWLPWNYVGSEVERRVA